MHHLRQTSTIWRFPEIRVHIGTWFHHFQRIFHGIFHVNHPAIGDLHYGTPEIFVAGPRTKPPANSRSPWNSSSWWFLDIMGPLDWRNRCRKPGRVENTWTKTSCAGWYECFHDFIVLVSETVSNFLKGVFFRTHPIVIPLEQAVSKGPWNTSLVPIHQAPHLPADVTPRFEKFPSDWDDHSWIKSSWGNLCIWFSMDWFKGKFTGNPHI